MMYPAVGESLERSSLIVVPRRIRNRNVVSPSSNQCNSIETISACGVSGIGAALLVQTAPGSQQIVDSGARR